MPRHAVFVLALALAAAAPAVADEWQKTYPVTGRPQLVLRTDDASVEVTPWDRPAVDVRVTTRGWSIGPRGIQVSVRQDGSRLECEVREPRFSMSFFFGTRWTHVDIKVPRGADVDVDTGDGSVRLGPLDGVARVHTGDGSIEAEDLRGEAVLSTSDGHIEAVGIDGSLTARTSDGSVRLEGRFDRLEARTSDGRIVARALEGSRLASGWTLSSGDGSVSLAIPRSLDADLDLRTGDGRLTTDVPVQVQGEFSRHALHGRLNGGGPTLYMRTGDGSIRLEALSGSAPAPAPRVAPAPRPAPRATTPAPAPRVAPKKPVKRAAPVPDTLGVET